MAEEVLVENLPMLLNLSDTPRYGPADNIGYAKVIRDSETGRNKIEITLDEEASIKLGNLVDVFNLVAIGFAGIKKRPVQKRES